MEKTSLGITVLSPDDGLDADNYSFQSENPKIISHLLELLITPGAVADPEDAPTVTTGQVGGTIDSDTDIEVTYTLIDADGGESAGAPVETITTVEPVEPPEEGPTLALDNVAGTLVAGTYEYAVSLTDGAGGETPASPATLIVRNPGMPNAEITIAGMTALVAASPGAAGWRLYRAKNSGPLYFLAQGAGAVDAFVDTGLGADCATVAPGEGENTTNATNTLTVTVPAQATAAVSFRIYAGIGVISSPALLGEYPIADLDADKVYTELLLDDGQPPDFSRSYAAGGPGGGGHIIMDEGDLLPARPAVDFVGVNVTVTDDPVNGKTIVTITGGTGGGGGGGGPRETVHLVATADVDPLASETGEIVVAPGYRILQVVPVTGFARVRLYDREATRDADVARDPATAPSGDHGLMLDANVGEGNPPLNLAPPVEGYNLDAPVTDAMYFTLSNDSFDTPATLAVDLVLVKTESLA